MSHVIDDLRGLIKAAHRQGEATEPLVITMPRDREGDLYDEPANGLPDAVRQKLYDDGPRAAFPRILGVPVIWDEDALGVKPLNKVDNRQREKYDELHTPKVR